MKLLLFDIDGTLIDAAGAGLQALQAGAKEYFGGEGPPLDLAGSTDEGVVRKMLDHFDLEPTSERIEGFYNAYHPQLEKHLNAETYEGVTLAGVEPLISALAASPQEFALGLLTGNTEQGAWHKVAAHGIDEPFKMGAWGSDHWDRNVLGPIALERAVDVFGHTFSAEQTVIIGDTPKDIACARACGAAVVAVATGRFSADELADADVVLDDLSDTAQVVDVLRRVQPGGRL